MRTSPVGCGDGPALARGARFAAIPARDQRAARQRLASARALRGVPGRGLVPRCRRRLPELSAGGHRNRRIGPPGVWCGPAATTPSDSWRAPAAEAMVGCMIRVALLYPQPSVLAALRRLIDSAPDLALVAAALDGQSLLEQLRWMRPDVVVIGDRPTPETASLVRRLKDEFGAAVGLFSTRVTPGLVSAARMARADGIVDGASQLPTVLEAIRRVARGDSVHTSVSHRLEPEALQPDSRPSCRATGVERGAGERRRSSSSSPRRTPTRRSPTRASSRRRPWSATARTSSRSSRCATASSSLVTPYAAGSCGRHCGARSADVRSPPHRCRRRPRPDSRSP
jgi:DNA-binding NarL/FixJ family response regulator